MSAIDMSSCQILKPLGRAALGWSCTRQFQAKPDQVSIELLGLNQTLLQLGLPIEQLFTLELVLAEVLNNVVEHAYQERGEGTVELSVWVHDGSVHCTVTDLGVAMPGGTLPLAQRHNTKVMALQDLPEGSFGWALIRDLTTDLCYKRVGNENRLSFRVDLAS